MELDEVLGRLQALGDPSALEGMARFGITPEKAFGVRIPDLRKLAREIGRDDALARRLWEAGYRETRILAGMVADAAALSEKRMEAWAGQFDYWEICDQVCMNLLQNSPLAERKCLEWAGRDEEFIKRAGFVLMARLAVSRKAAEDAFFEPFLPVIVREATDERVPVRKAVNWALRQIGKRNLRLNRKALAAAERIGRLDSKAARWIASDAIRELESDAVQKRLRDN